MRDIRLVGLPPLIDERARVLILGSFPSAASLAAQHYYAHAQNQFWRILAAVLEQPLAAMDYAAKQATLKAAGIAVWDVYGACTRDGSLDSAIRDAVPNDFGRIRKNAPQLRRVCFNGKTAGRFSPTLVALGYGVVILPSTSAANATCGFERKCDAWREALSAP